LLTPRPIPSLEDYRFSVFRDCLSNTFGSYFPVGRLIRPKPEDVRYRSDSVHRKERNALNMFQNRLLGKHWMLRGLGWGKYQ